MIGMVRDTWRAVLVLVVGTILLGRHTPTVGTYAGTPTPAQRAWEYPSPPQMMQPCFPPPQSFMPMAHAPTPAAPAWGQAPPIVITAASQPDRPLLRVAESVVALGDSVLGVIR